MYNVCAHVFFFFSFFFSQGKSSRAKLEKTGSGSLSSEAGTSSSLSRGELVEYHSARLDGQHSTKMLAAVVLVKETKK